MQRIDLHCHSSASDGVLSPVELLERALSKDVDVLAITDHDTVAGYREIPAALADKLQLIPGAEFSSRWENHSIHVVGLNLALESSALLEAIASQTEVRTRRAEEIARTLQRLGLPDLLDDARERAGTGVVGRPHFARAMLARGLVGSMEQAFRWYLGQGRPGDVQNGWPGLLKTVQCIHAAGGVAVLAHPCNYRFSRRQRQRLITAFRASGGDAVEIISGRQDPEQTRILARDVAAMGLAGSLGSDFHAPRPAAMDLGETGPLPAGLRPVWSLF